MKKIFFILFITLLSFNFNSNSFAANETGEATEYKITMMRLQLCTGLTTASSQTTCDNALEIGQGSSGLIDLAVVEAGQGAASYGDLTKAKSGTTYSHIQVTLSRKFTITGCTTTCCTASGDAAEVTHATGFVAGQTGGTAASRILVAPVGTDSPSNVNSVTAADGSGTRADDGELTQNHEFMEWRGAFTKPVTIGAKVPTIKVAFGTTKALGMNTSGDCGSTWAEAPDVTLSIQ